MKSCLVLIVVLAASALYAQSTNAPATNAVSGAHALGFEARTAGPGSEPTFVLRQAKPNEIFKGDIIYSGIAVELFKTRRPLQLLNPRAAPQYGSPEDNLVRDPINGRSTGLKLFAIRF